MINQSSGALCMIYASDLRFSRTSLYTPGFRMSFCDLIMYYLGGGGVIGFLGSGWMKGGGSGIVTPST